ncbi:MAG TPA: carbohydrate ABC transporter permease [bacterium]|nr:carbohydrate ABC transporter permease [bacterium]
MESTAVKDPMAPTKPNQRGVFSRQDRKRRDVQLVLFSGTVLLLLGGVVTLLPIIWMVLGSFKEPSEIYSVPQTYLPKAYDFTNYLEAIRLVDFGRYFLNSMFFCAAVVACQLLVSSMAAYSLTKLRVRFSGGILLLFMTSLMVPMEVLVIPLYLIMKYFPFGAGLAHTNLINTYWAVILPGIFSAFSILVLKDFYDSIPNEIIYAARIDHCTETRIFFRFMLPMTKPIMSILAVFSFVTTWNSFFWPLIVLNNPDYYPIVLGVQKLIDTGEPWNVVMAALVLSTIPSVLVLLFFQKTIIRGIAYTGIYG